MPISLDFEHISPSSIIIQREDRQRKLVDTSGLKESIALNGVLQPIIVTRDLVLVAGERRLTSTLELGLPSIPVRYLDELSPHELQVIELEENLKREDLHWRDQVSAMAKLHDAYCGIDPEWTPIRTAEALSVNRSWISKILRIARDFDSPRIAQATGINAAFNMLAKIDERKNDTAFSEILEGIGEAWQEPATAPGNPQSGHGLIHDPAQSDLPLVPLPAYSVVSAPGLPPAIVAPVVPSSLAPPAPVVVPPPLPTPEESILNCSFLEWAPAYSGPKFNLIHCDFPYGINAYAGSKATPGGANSSADMGPGGVAAANAALYDDSPDVYWNLLECFCTHMDNFMAHSAHVVFWFSMHHYSSTLQFLSRKAPSLTVNPVPLVWVKSDNRGVLPDPKRGPRHVYETALIASREDRFILRATANSYSAPTDKTYHHSAKPEPMLRFFLDMFVDETTSLLDPTCGGGSAIRAAESLGAKRALGLELDPGHCDLARQALRKFRALRKAGL